MRLLSKLSVLLILISPVVVGQPTAPAPVSVMPRQPMLTANAFILVDYDSGKVLAEQNSEQIVEPASLTKMMTMYIVDNEIKAGKLHLTDNIQISKRAWQAPGSRMFVQVDTGVTVQDLIRGIIIQSGNDSSMALAEHIAGSEQTFADLMNTYAQLLGMKNSHFKNATGLPDKEHVTTAKDMAILARAIIKNFPDTYQIYSQKEFVYNGIKQHNRNRLLWRNPAVDGIKTGFTDSAGYCLVASGKVNNMRLIAVIMGAPSEPARTEDANRLLMWGFKFFETNQIYQAGTKMQDIRVWGGSDKRLGIGFTDSVYITTPQGAFKKYTATTNLPASLKAPIKQGDAVGSYVIRDEQNQVIFEQPIVALQTIEKGNIYQRTRDYFKQSFRSVTSKFKS